MASQKRKNRLANSVIPFQDARTGEAVAPLIHQRVLLDSQWLEWTGVVVERGTNDSFHPVEVKVPYHYFALNCDEPLSYRFKNDAGKMEAVRMDTGRIWVHPANVPFTHQVTQRATYLLVAIDPAKAASCVPELHQQGRWTFRCDRTADDTKLRLLMETLESEVASRGESGLKFFESIVTALTTHYYLTYGTLEKTVTRAPPRLSEERFSRAERFLRAHIAERIGLEDVAKAAGLSRYEFIRQFKAVAGVPPHQYLLQLKLDEGRKRLLRGQGIAEVAYDLGFADQSHFTRHFKTRFQMTPRAAAKQK